MWGKPTSWVFVHLKYISQTGVHMSSSSIECRKTPLAYILQLIYCTKTIYTMLAYGERESPGPSMTASVFVFACIHNTYYNTLQSRGPQHEEESALEKYCNMSFKKRCTLQFVSVIALKTSYTYCKLALCVQRATVISRCKPVETGLWII